MTLLLALQTLMRHHAPECMFKCLLQWDSNTSYHAADHKIMLSLPMLLKHLHLLANDVYIYQDMLNKWYAGFSA